MRASVPRQGTTSIGGTLMVADCRNHVQPPGFSVRARAAACGDARRTAAAHSGAHDSNDLARQRDGS
jgi:hypothetical protein